MRSGAVVTDVMALSWLNWLSPSRVSAAVGEAGVAIIGSQDRRITGLIGCR